MRIVIVGPTYPYKGGGAQHTTQLAHYLARAGHDVVIETWRAQYPSFLYPGRQTIAEPEGEPFPHVRRELDWRRPDGWLRAGRRMRRADLVVLAVFSSVQVPPYLGMLYGLRRQAKVIALCHNVLPHERRPYDEPLMRALLKRVDGVLVHSDEQAALARRLTAVPIGVIGLPPHLPVKVTRLPRPEGRRNRLLFFGIVRPYKGLDVLLRALAAGPPEVSLTVAGEFWGGEEETRELIAELGIADRVEIRSGYVPGEEMPHLFAAADALVLPYRSGTGSQNVWLGHEYGLPVIATRVGTLPEHLNDGVDGLLVEPESVEDLTDAIKRLYAPGELERLRAGVKSVDPEPFWLDYVAALLRVCPVESA